MNRPPKHNLNTVDAVVDELISELDLRDKVDTANLPEEDLAILQAVLTSHISGKMEVWSINDELYQDCLRKSGDESLDKADAATVILKELGVRLRETHKLRVVK
jgi:hypothetical protein